MSDLTTKIVLATVAIVQVTGNHCGLTYADAKKCEVACPNGVTEDCPVGEICFHSVECTGNDTTTTTPTNDLATGSYCGTNATTAAQCSLPCRSGFDSDCNDPTMTCMDGIVCDFLKIEHEEPLCNADTPCPLNACCSEWGYCGWTDDFCNDRCTSNCDAAPVAPACDGNATQVRLGYYASWATTDRLDCRPAPPSSFASSANDYTHLVFSFAHVSADFKLVSAGPEDEPLYKEFTDLKLAAPDTNMLIAIGGWAFNDHPYQDRFTNMANSTESRAVFIQSAIDFMVMYNFDGIDLDWEYPGAPDRGGRDIDFVNYVLLVSEMRAAFVAAGKDFSITMAVPLSNWYLRHFDIAALQEHVDFFNVMSYDLHGVWDSVIDSLGAYVVPHTSMAEIEVNFNMFWKNGIKPSKLVLGLAAYGRTYVLADPTCTDIGCPFQSAGAPGVCTKVAGFQGHFEIEQIIASGQYEKVTFDAESGAMVLVQGTNWMAYDSAETFSLKKDFAAENCLRGTMIWSIDMIDAGIVYPSTQ